MQILKVIISSIGKKKGLLLDTVGFMCWYGLLKDHGEKASA